jgi:histone deacetylase complex regulatory component SIN3
LILDDFDKWTFAEKRNYAACVVKDGETPDEAMLRIEEERKEYWKDVPVEWTLHTDNTLEKH